MKQGIARLSGVLALILMMLVAATIAAPSAHGAVGDEVHQITPPIPGSDTGCSIGLAFDGTSLYYDRCGDGNIYKINPLTAALEGTFDTGIAEFPNALAFDGTRNGIWVGSQSCNPSGMPIYFWDFDDDSVTLMFTIPTALTNPATGSPFLSFCFIDGIAFNANDAADPSDDEIWVSDDLNPNVALFRPDGTLVQGYDATSVDPSLADTSGIAIGGATLYLANDGGGDVFRADPSMDPLTLVDQFTSGDDRQEDMECDPVTFAPTEVMWVRTTPQGDPAADLITAFEIEPDTCGFGGGVEPEPTPEPTPTPQETETPQPTATVAVAVVAGITLPQTGAGAQGSGGVTGRLIAALLGSGALAAAAYGALRLRPNGRP